MKRTMTILLLIFISNSNNLIAQNRSSIWHFGNNIELNFCSGSPVVGTGPIVTDEGCASITDDACNWQFSTDGIDLIVPNPPPFGSIINNDLLGNPTSTSSAIIVPKPCDSDIYYIFTVDYVDGSDGIRFSVYDQTLNAGNGGIRPNEKNIFLAGPSAERITAIKHANGKDYWVIAVMQNSNDFHRWLVTCQGVSNVGPILQTGPIITRSYGYLKASHCCNRLAMAFRNDVLLYGFDNSSGFINHISTLTLATNNTMYGVEFTFDCSSLIATELGSNNGPGANIYRISDPCTNPALAQTWNVPNSNGRYTLGAVQLGPDDVLYIAKDLENTLATIDPTGTMLTQNSIPLQAGTFSTLGLPTLISGDIDEACTNLTRLPTQPTNLKLADLGYSGVEYADVTSDGLFDVIATSGNDIIYFTNTGSLGSPIFNFTSPNILYTVVPNSGYGMVSFTMYDYNNSGVPDLFILKETSTAGGFKQIDYVSGNIGLSYGAATIVYPASSGNGLPNSHEQFMEVANLDADPEPELLMSSGSGNGAGILYFDGVTGSPFGFTNSPLMTVCLPTVPFYSTFAIPELYDADCDGDLDLFLGVSTDLLYYENTGNSTSFILQDCNTLVSPCQTTTSCTFQAVDFGISNVGGNTEHVFPRFVEVNNDGKEDLFITRNDCASGCHIETQYYESQDCCECPYELCFNYSPIPSGTYEADHLIKASGTIPLGNNVTFKSDSKRYGLGFTVNGTLTDIMPGCSSCCAVTDPLVDLAWLAIYVGDPNYAITKYTWNGECIIAVSDFCLVSDGIITYYDCEGVEICFSFGFGSTCPPNFTIQNGYSLQSC